MKLGKSIRLILLCAVWQLTVPVRGGDPGFTPGDLLFAMREAGIARWTPGTTNVEQLFPPVAGTLDKELDLGGGKLFRAAQCLSPEVCRKVFITSPDGSSEEVNLPDSRFPTDIAATDDDRFFAAYRESGGGYSIWARDGSTSVQLVSPQPGSASGLDYHPTCGGIAVSVNEGTTAKVLFFDPDTGTPSTPIVLDELDGALKDIDFAPGTSDPCVLHGLVDRANGVVEVGLISYAPPAARSAAGASALDYVIEFVPTDLVIALSVYTRGLSASGDSSGVLTFLDCCPDTWEAIGYGAGQAPVPLFGGDGLIGRGSFVPDETLSGACCLGNDDCIETTADDCSSQDGSYLGDLTECTPDLCSSSNVGACCLEDECLVLSEQDCVLGGGWSFEGEGTVCTPDPCFIDIGGACCLGTDECIETTHDDCSSQGGSYLDDLTGCTPDLCSTSDGGACCLEDECLVLSEQECLSGGGLYEGEGTVCTPDLCFIDVGPCCLGADDCIETTADDCYSQDGIFVGSETECTPDLCSTSDGGACCLEDECLVLSEQECISGGGWSYEGDGTVCTPDPCGGPATGACCTDEMTCVDVATAADCSGSFLGEGTTCGATFSVAALDEIIVVDTCASDYNTELSIFDRCGGTPIVTNDDCSAGCPAGGSQGASCACIATFPGENYFIRVHGSWGAPPPDGGSTSVSVQHGDGNADGDLYPDRCDNCPDDSAPSQSDWDSDKEGNACDADDGEITLLHDGTRLLWVDEQYPGKLGYNVYQGAWSVLLDTGIYSQPLGSSPLADRGCGLPIPGFVDAASIPPGELAFFLVTIRLSDGETGLGLTGNGFIRPNDVPCE